MTADVRKQDYRSAIQLLAIVGFTVIFYIGNYQVEFNSTLARWWANMGWTLAALLAGVRCLMTASQLSGYYRKAWQFFGFACLSWFVGMLIWDYQELVLGNTIPFPAFSDIGFLSFAPLMMVGLLYYRTEVTSVALTFKQLSELGIILFTAVITFIIILYEPIIELEQPRLYLVVAIAYPVLYLGLLLFALLQLFQKPAEGDRIIIVPLLCGIGIHAFTDTVYAYSLLGRTYDIGHFLDVLWVIGFGCVYWSAVVQSRMVSEYGKRVNVQEKYETEYEALIPSIAIAWIALMAFIFQDNITPQISLYIFPMIIGLAICMAVLGWMNYQYHIRLNKQTLKSKQELMKAYDELDRRVIERTRDLEEAMMQAERANQIKSIFLSNMSHELRTPLNAVLGFAQLLKHDTDSPLNDEQREHVDEVLNAGQHLLDLINEVLDLAKVESGKLEVSLEAIAVSPIIEACVKLIRPLAEKESIALHVELPPEEVWVSADPVRLKQVLINILSNAIKYNKKPGSVWLSTEIGSGDRLRIAIKDSGTGIEQENLGEIFDPFTRYNKLNEEGAGIGLSVSRQLLKLMQGSIGVESCVGEGSLFWIDLKLVRDQ